MVLSEIIIETLVKLEENTLSISLWMNTICVGKGLVLASQGCFARERIKKCEQQLDGNLRRLTGKGENRSCMRCCLRLCGRDAGKQSRTTVCAAGKESGVLDPANRQHAKFHGDLQAQAQ